MNENENKNLDKFLNMRSDKFTIVLNDNELELFKNTDFIYNQFMTHDCITPVYIACICHDRDKVDGTENVKTKHYHVVVQFDKVARIGTIINYISDMFKCNANQITIEKCTSICMQSRYLIHADDFDKAEYFFTEVKTNASDVFQRYLSLVIVRDYHDLINVVDKYRYDLKECMQNIAHYDKWRRAILDLISDHYRRKL